MATSNSEAEKNELLKMEERRKRFSEDVITNSNDDEEKKKIERIKRFGLTPKEELDKKTVELGESEETLKKRKDRFKDDFNQEGNINEQEYEKRELENFELLGSNREIKKRVRLRKRIGNRKGNNNRRIRGIKRRNNNNNNNGGKRRFLNRRNNNNGRRRNNFNRRKYRN